MPQGRTTPTLAVIGAIVVVGLGFLVKRSPQAADAPAVIDVFVMRDLDGLRLTNDSPSDVYNCEITIDGGQRATISELPPSGRASLSREDFDRTMPRDEFYSRTLRSLRMTCLDGSPGNQGRQLRVNIR